MSSPPPANPSKIAAQAANAMINEGGAIEQPSKEESEATLDQVIKKSHRNKDETASKKE